MKILEYSLIKTKKRLTFDILYQTDQFFRGKTDDDYITFKASNGIEIISRSRMDIQTDRIWLLGCSFDERSGSMVFSSDEKRDKMFNLFQDALKEWAEYIKNLIIEKSGVEKATVINSVAGEFTYNFIII